MLPEGNKFVENTLDLKRLVEMDIFEMGII